VYILKFCVSNIFGTLLFYYRSSTKCFMVNWRILTGTDRQANNATNRLLLEKREIERIIARILAGHLDAWNSRNIANRRDGSRDTYRAKSRARIIINWQLLRRLCLCLAYARNMRVQIMHKSCVRPTADIHSATLYV